MSSLTSSQQINHAEVTTAAIVAGRTCLVTRTVSWWEQFCRELDQLAGRTQLPIVVVLGLDLPNTDPAEPVPTAAVIGLLVAAVDRPQPAAVAWASLRTSVERAGSLPWDEIAALLGPVEAPDQGLADEIRQWAVATGPLAGVRVAFGVPAKDESELLAWSEGSPQSQEPSLDFVAGRGMDERPVEDGIWGVEISYAGDWEQAALDITPAMHRDNLELLGQLAPGASYYLMASYD